jgi:hypothetical protein
LWRSRYRHCGALRRLGLRRRRHRRRRSHGLSLAAGVSDRHGIRHVVDDDRIVDVVVDDIVGRRRYVRGWADPNRNRSVDRDWQDEKRNGRRGRREHHEFRRRRRQEDDRRGRWRRKRKDRVVKDEYRPLNIDDFFRQRRRQVIG